MRKNIRRALMLIVTVTAIAVICVFGVSAENEWPYVYEINNGQVTIIDCDPSIEGEVIIPEKLGGIPVTAIGDKAFFYCASISRVEIGEHITSIGENAFGCCFALSEVVLPENLTAVSKEAFYMCYNLQQVNLGQTKAEVIGEKAFYYCEYITTIAIPDTVTTIEASAFNSCSSLENLILGSGVKTIGENAFANCYNLRTVYCMGNEESKNAISLSQGNDRLTASYFYYEHIHLYDSVKVIDKGTCVKNGRKLYTCRCTDSYTEKTKGSHSYKNTVTKATASKNGKTVNACKYCGKVKKTTVIPKAVVKLEKTSYAYSGKAIKPAVKVTDANGKTLKAGTDYTVTYQKGRKSIGKYYVKITFKGTQYKGSKTLYFKITPKKAAINSLTSPSAGKAVVKWDKLSVTGYELYMATTKAGTYNKIKTVTKNTVLSFTKTGLKSGKTYYFKVRAYKTVNNEKIYGAFSNVKSLRIK